eukprot:1643170-Amphidinium_carterae.1
MSSGSGVHPSWGLDLESIASETVDDGHQITIPWQSASQLDEPAAPRKRRGRPPKIFQELRAQHGSVPAEIEVPVSAAASSSLGVSSGRGGHRAPALHVH